MSKYSSYQSQFSYWENFNKKKEKGSLLALGKTFLKVIKIFLLFFMVVTFFWGLGTLFFDEDVRSNEVELLDADGNVFKKTYLSGVFFELTAGYNQAFTFKNHVFHLADGQIYEYDYLSSNNVKEIWGYSDAPFYAILVLPISWFMNKIAFLFSWSDDSLGSGKNLTVMIFTIFFASLILRLITGYGVWKQQKNQMKMKEIQARVELIKEKYKEQTSPEAKQRMQWEIMSLYKKENVNPLSAALEGFAFAPLLFAMFVVVRTSRILKDSSTTNFSFTTTIWDGITTEQNFIYLIPTAIYFLFFAFDNFFLTKYLEKQQVKKIINKKPQKTSQKLLKWGFKILFVIFFFIVPVGTSVYWIFSSFFEILQKTLLFNVEKFRKKQAILKKHGKKITWWNLKPFWLKDRS